VRVLTPAIAAASSGVSTSTSALHPGHQVHLICDTDLLMTKNSWVSLVIMVVFFFATSLSDRVMSG
jgi:hypothetical protein